MCFNKMHFSCSSDIVIKFNDPRIFIWKAIPNLSSNRIIREINYGTY